MRDDALRVCQVWKMADADDSFRCGETIERGKKNAARKPGEREPEQASTFDGAAGCHARSIVQRRAGENNLWKSTDVHRCFLQVAILSH